MSNNINLSAGRAVNAAISHIENNSFRFTNVGIMAALRDSSLQRLIDATNPFNVAQSDGGRNLLPTINVPTDNFDIYTQEEALQLFSGT